MKVKPAQSSCATSGGRGSRRASGGRGSRRTSGGRGSRRAKSTLGSPGGSPSRNLSCSSTSLQNNKRRGYGLIELSIAIFLLTVTMGIMVKAVTWVGIERRAAERRVVALLEVSNLLELLTAEPFESITNERAKALAETLPAAKTLPGASWEFEVADSKAGALTGKRISAKLRWNDRSAGWDGPVAVSCWVYPRRKS